MTAARNLKPPALGFTPPCLARAVERPPHGDNWVHEIKFDGYRVQALVAAGRVRLLTRTALDWTSRFGRVAGEVAALPVTSAVLDCEAVVTDDAGVSNFSSLQRELKKGPAAAIQLMAFDLLHLNGADTSRLPLLERKAALEDLVKRNRQVGELLRFSAHAVGRGSELLQNACAMHLEGIVSKRTDLPYRSGRNGDWTKSKCVMADPFLVIGFVASKGAAGIVGSLVLGFYDRGEIVYAGRVGTGFTQAEARAMADGLGAIRRKTAPLKQRLTREQSNGVQWVMPNLVAQVTYRDVTSDNIVRHASFQHFRDDKRPGDIGMPASFGRLRGLAGGKSADG